MRAGSHPYQRQQWAIGDRRTSHYSPQLRSSLTNIVPVTSQWRVEFIDSTTEAMRARLARRSAARAVTTSPRDADERMTRNTRMQTAPDSDRTHEDPPERDPQPDVPSEHEIDTTKGHQLREQIGRGGAIDPVAGITITFVTTLTASPTMLTTTILW